MTAADKDSSIRQILSASFIPGTQSLNLTGVTAVTDQRVTQEASVEQIFRAVFDPATQALRATGGAGNITGSIATNQVAFASAANTISGSNNFTWTNGTNTLNVTGNAVFSTIGANRMPFTDGSNNITGSANYTVNGTGGLTIAQTLTATGGAFAAGVIGFNITGANASCNVGTNFNLAQAGSSGTFFSGTVSGDTVIRQINTGLSIYLGVGSATPQLQIANTVVNFRVNPSIISSTNPALNIASNTSFAQVTSAAAIFSNSAIGDTVLVQTNVAKAIRLGVTAVAGLSGLDITNTGITANLPISTASSLLVSTTGTFNGLLTALNVSTGGVTLSTSGGTAAALNYYEEAQVFTASMSCPDGAFHTLTFTVTRIGKMVALEWPILSITATVSVKFTAVGGTVPTRWRPTVNRQYAINVTNNSVNVSGTFIVNTDGSLEVGVGPASGTFTGSGTAAFLASSVSYQTT